MTAAVQHAEVNIICMVPASNAAEAHRLGSVCVLHRRCLIVAAGPVRLLLDAGASSGAPNRCGVLIGRELAVGTSTGSWPVAMLLAVVALVLLPGRVAVSRRLRVLRVAEPASAGVVRDRRGGADPLAVASIFDLLAACLRAGLPMTGAARAVAPGAPAELGDALRRAADLLALGADAPSAWERATHDAAGGPGAAEVESLARMARRSARSGASLAVAVTELAEQRRAAVEDAAAARAERAGVLISGPLGLCFLPAFICLGIVPVVIGLAGRVLGEGLL